MKRLVTVSLIGALVLLSACGGGNTAPVTPPVTPPITPPVTPPGPPSGASSGALIDDALAKGEIDADSALKYKVFAAFNDARLPAKFKGDDARVFETDALQDLNARFDSLSSENQTALAAFLLRPSNKGSWANPVKTNAGPRLTPQSRPACDGDASGWAAFNTTNLKANVWYQTGVPGQFAKAKIVAEAIDAKIWPNLITTLGFKEPLSDTSDFGCYGGDSRLDVYLVTNVGFRALAQPEGLSTKQAPVYIMLDTTKLSSDNDLRAGVTHEIMHAIQFAYTMASSQSSYGWLRDAMANWAIDEVYAQTIQLEQEYADCFTSTPALSLDDRSPGHCVTQPSGVNRDYGAYLFLQFIARTAGPSAVRKSLEATVVKNTSLEAVDSSIPGGFKDQWWKFAKTLWNQGPTDAKPDSFKRWDNLNETPKSRDSNGDLNGAPEAKENFETEQNNLSSRYYRFTFSDPNTRSILFYNGFFDQIKAGKAVKIMALWKDTAGTWQEEDPSNTAQDWSQYKYVGLCRDIKTQRASELIIIVTNAESEPGGKVTASKTPYLKRSNVGCLKYEGQATRLETASDWSGLGRKAVSNINFELNPAQKALDAKNPVIPDSLRLGLTLAITWKGTDYSFEVAYASGGCSYSFGPATFPLGALTDKSSGGIFINNFPELEANESGIQEIIDFPNRAYLPFAVDSQFIDVNVSGKGCDSTEKQLVGPLLLTDPANPPLVKPDGTMQESLKFGGSTDDTFNWAFSPKSEP